MLLYDRLAAHADAVIHTHASIVFLAGDDVYKLKKPVDFGFLDYSTLQKRGSCCLEEVRLNRRWSQGIYRGVVAVTDPAAGGGFDGDGEPVEWAVHMARYPEDATLLSILARGELSAADVTNVGETIGRIHLTCPRSELARTHGSFESLAGFFRANFDETQHSQWVAPTLHAALRKATEEALSRTTPLWRQRQAAQVRELHGDLRLEHVLLRGDRIDVVDTIEFSDALRCGDPIIDIAFLAMDLGVRGRPDLADALYDAWEQATGDVEARALFPVTAAYRSIVRAKVAELQRLDPDVPPYQKQVAETRARRHWLWAASILLSPKDRPALVGIGGLPGTGKSTLAREMADAHGFTVVQADVVRKELAGLPIDAPTPEARKAEMYRPEHKAEVFATCLARATAIVRDGGRAIVDTTFSRPQDREALLAAGALLGVPTALWLCDADEATVIDRIRSRPVGASDADVDVYRKVRAAWVESAEHLLDTSSDFEATCTAGTRRLQRAGMA